MIRVIDNKFSAILGSRLIKISQVARDTGISRTTLTNIYYKRSTYITFTVLNKLCGYLECGVDDLFPYVTDSDAYRKEGCRSNNSPDGKG